MQSSDFAYTAVTASITAVMIGFTIYEILHCTHWFLGAAAILLLGQEALNSYKASRLIPAKSL